MQTINNTSRKQNKGPEKNQGVSSCLFAKTNTSNKRLDITVCNIGNTGMGK